MLVGIHQLHYLPWLRYFEKIARSDVFIVLDDIQFTKNDWQNRNRVKTAAGATVLTLPVIQRLGQRLNEVQLDNHQPWRHKHLQTLVQAYARAPWFREHEAFLRDVYARPWTHMDGINRFMLEYFVKALGITTPIRYSSELGVEGAATERLIRLIQAVGGDAYYSGAYALQVYLDARQLEEAGIALVLQDWHAPEYPQLHGSFVKDLGIVDLLMNCGPDSLDILMGRAA
jgi:hypothetical protein